MKFDPVVLGKDCILTDDSLLPNANVMIDGSTGVGKSTSVLLPTLLKMDHMNPILSCCKEHEALSIVKMLRAKGYEMDVLDLIRPEVSTCAYDPVRHLKTNMDICHFSATVINSVIRKTNDDYWSKKSEGLLRGLLYLLLMSSKQPDLKGLLELFGRTLTVGEDSSRFASDLEPMVNYLRQEAPHSPAARELSAWQSLPFRTASCVRDTLQSAISSSFPEAVCDLITGKPSVDWEKLTSRKAGLMLISSSEEPWQSFYCNIFWKYALRELRSIAESMPEGHLKRPVRLCFEDFAAGCPITGFENSISVFRSMGISAAVFLQSQSQLEAVYGSREAAIIRQNCAVHVYFPGGMDERSAEITSRKMDLPFSDILYSPLGRVFIMMTGKKICTTRYNTFEDRDYRRYLGEPEARAAG